MNNNSLSGINIITASGDIEAGSITTMSGNVSSTSGNIQKRYGIVGGIETILEPKCVWGKGCNGPGFKRYLLGDGFRFSRRY